MPGDISKEELLKEFGAHLRRLRESKELSAAELARRCLMDRGNYTKLESGLKDAQLLTLHRIAIGLNITMEELFREFKT